MQLLESFSIDWQLILAQAVSFLILLIVLKKFVYKPLIDMVNKRRDMIENSLLQKKEIEEQMEDLRKYHEEQIKKTQVQAQEIIARAEANAEKERLAQIEKTEAEINVLFAQAKKDIESQKEEMIKGAEVHMAEILIPAIEKILEQSADDASRQQIYEKSLQRVNQLYKKSA